MGHARGVEIAVKGVHSGVKNEPTISADTEVTLNFGLDRFREPPL
jgi:hypothetical protein